MARPITDALRDLRGGQFVDEATEALAEVVNAVMETGKPGKVTIELAVKRATKASGALVIADKVTTKVPTDGPSESFLFATPEGSLVASDPRQAKLELREVPEPNTGPLKVAAGQE